MKIIPGWRFFVPPAPFLARRFIQWIYVQGYGQETRLNNKLNPVILSDLYFQFRICSSICHIARLFPTMETSNMNRQTRRCGGGGGNIRGNNQFRQIFGIRGTRSTPRKLCGCLACPILVLLLTNGNAARQANTPTLLGNLLLALLTETIRTIAHERLYWVALTD